MLLLLLLLLSLLWLLRRRLQLHTTTTTTASYDDDYAIAITTTTAATTHDYGVHTTDVYILTGSAERKLKMLLRSLLGPSSWLLWPQASRVLRFGAACFGRAPLGFGNMAPKTTTKPAGSLKRPLPQLNSSDDEPPAGPAASARGSSPPGAGASAGSSAGASAGTSAGASGASAEKTFKLLVEILDGGLKLTLDVKATTTFLEIKRMIEIEEGIPVADQDLSHSSGGGWCPDDKTLADYNIDEENAMFTSLPLLCIKDGIR